jgi:hypothetical protein
MNFDSICIEHASSVYVERQSCNFDHFVGSQVNFPMTENEGLHGCSAALEKVKRSLDSVRLRETSQKLAQNLETILNSPEILEI